jgi:hypothetical protein
MLVLPHGQYWERGRPARRMRIATMNKSVKTNTTIPQWLKTAAEKRSTVLLKGLLAELENRQNHMMSRDTVIRFNLKPPESRYFTISR